jgi:hypothetical protein
MVRLMNKRQLVFIFAAMILLSSGCATVAKYEARLNTFIGQSEGSLIASWGVPRKEYRLDSGKKAVEYARKDLVQTGGDTFVEERTVSHSGVIGDKPYSGISTQYVTQTSPVEQYKLYCKTSFVINTNGTVESWHHEGNNCVSE